MKILVTGATGHLGRHLLKALLAKRHSVRIIARSADEVDALLKGKIQTVQLDLANASEKDFEKALEGIDAVVHAAAIGVVDSPPKSLVKAINVEATRKLVYASVKKRIKRFVFISSSALFHNPTQIPINENQTPTPGNAYGRSKFEAERIIRESGLPYCILRPVVIYGPGFERAFAPLVKAVRKGKMKMIGSGENHFPAVHVSDVVNAILLGLTEKKAVGEAFNVSGPALTQKQWLALIAKLLNVEPPEKRMPLWLALLLARMFEFQAALTGKKPFLTRDNVRRLSSDRVFSTKKIERLLKWKARVSPEAGLKDLLKSL